MSKPYERYNDRIIGKIIIRADIVNKSPLLIGKGEGETDIDVLLWDDGRPYIPASSFAGCLSSFFTRNLTWLPQVVYPTDNEKLLCLQLWGKAGDHKSKKKDDEYSEVLNYQSHVIFDDLLPDNNAKNKINFRDGVRIDHKTNIAVNQGKYDYQLIEPEVNFRLNAEITIRNGMDKNTALKLAATIQSIIDCKYFRLGRLGNTGFGEVKCENFKIHYFDFDDKIATRAWFDFLDDENKLPVPQKDISAFELKFPSSFSISATFKLKSALITGAYSVDKGQPDKSQLKCNDKYVLSGKSIRGALRHRAVKILNTLAINNPDLVKDLMGFVDNEHQIEKTRRGKLKVFESDLSNYSSMIQQRIRIDRFTGGVIKGALFDSAPIWQNEDGTFDINLLSINPTPIEKTLLMHLLKDLWTSDLAIGGEKNVGRGVLVGQKAIITENDTVLAVIEKDAKNTIKFTEGDYKKFNDWTFKS